MSARKSQEIHYFILVKKYNLCIYAGFVVDYVA